MTTTDEARVTAAISTPPTFPVAWERPGDERLSWLTDRMHFPAPITPLDDWLTGCLWDGSNRATATYGFPFHCESRRINTYAYFAIVPDAGPPAELAARERAAYDRLQAAIGRLRLAWEGELLPEIKGHLAAWEAFDPRGASSAALLKSLAAMRARQVRLWELHDRLWLPMNTALSLFDDLYGEPFGAERAAESWTLLQGFDNATLRLSRALWELSRRALDLPEARRALLEHGAADVPAALERSADGRAFLAELRAYLAEYGQRADTWGLSEPSWIEDPTPAIKNLQDELVRPERDPLAETAALAAERERLVAAARERLRGHPAGVVERFEFLLAAAQAAIVLTEDHNFWIDTRSAYHARRLFLEVGRRLAAAGALAGPEDVFYLTVDELREAAAAPSPGDRRAVVAGRQAEMAYYRTIAPPPALGTAPPAPAADDAVMRGIDKFFGAAPEPSADPTELRGHAGSPGIARGPARVVHSLAEAARLRPGDVLVTATTSPAWTPLFATAAAIVTDTGGVLSHCAVVAREYGLPAVVGVGVATAALRDGQLVEVDGGAGLVRIITDA